MFNKNDPLIGAVSKIMEQNELARQVEKALCEELGIYSRKALPNEHLANYDALLEQRMKEAVSPSEYSEKQKKLAKVGTESGHGGDPKKIDAPDLKAARKGHASHIEEERIDEVLDTKEKKEKYKNAATKSLKDSFGKKDKDSAHTVSKRIYGLSKIKEEMQDSKNPLPPSSAKDRIQNKLGTGAKSSVDPSYKHQGAGASDREEMNKKVQNLDEKMSDDDKASVALRKVVAKHKLKDAAKETRPGYVKKQSQEWYNKMTKRANTKIEEEIELDEAARSKVQQRIMGMALAMRRGESDRGSDKVKKIATDMSDDEMSKFAKTKHKGLPEKKKKMDENLTIDDVMEEIARNLGEEKMKEIEEQASLADRTKAAIATGNQIRDQKALGLPEVPFRPNNIRYGDKTGTRSVNRNQEPEAPPTSSPRPEFRPLTIRQNPQTPAPGPAPGGPYGRLIGPAPSTSLPSMAATGPKLEPSSFRGNTPSVSVDDALGDTGKKTLGSYAGVKATGFASDKPAPTPRPAAPRPAPTASPKPAAAPVDPNAKSKAMFQSYSDKGDDASSASFFAADKQRTAELKGMREDVMNESLANTIRKVLKG